MTAPDLSLCLVLGTREAGARGLFAVVDAAVRGGVTAVQLRDKHATARELLRLAVELRGALAGTGVPVIVNDRLDIALAAGADGVHLGQSDLDVESARRLGGPDLLIGLSVSNAAEMAAACALPTGAVDYLGIGPVFPTTTKTDAAPALGLDAVAALRAGTSLPCIGIGGITLENAASAWAAGLDGLAVASAICAADDPGAAAASLRMTTRPRSGSH